MGKLSVNPIGSIKSGEDGTFATRSPLRPNPVAISVVHAIHIDEEQGVIRIPYIDANEGSPVIDLKPYSQVSIG